MTFYPFEEELARGQARMPFANGFEADAWMSTWCNRCLHQHTCPLVDVALWGVTPQPWTETHPNGLADRYECSEWVQAP